ncbi:hypothetical protein EHS25_005268 [Saitozyma podzolica]|uniref:NADH dehydrogenase [ubiquinone] 1 alpha subcomplex subunit 1 n=1 Tax=Saitozyma podzolica TaxID=1890683 RepID=A0A427XYY0_9TREE|nr:hypothetical protein EHS25_005268 [Saitozyma podzolica]
MPVPWEALIPFALLTACFGATGTLFSVAKRATNDGKPPRYNLDAWDQMMVERDRRLTGSHRGQSTEPIAPKGFATSSIWQTERIQ